MDEEVRKDVESVHILGSVLEILLVDEIHEVVDESVAGVHVLDQLSLVILH